MPKMRRKGDLPTKICVACGLPFTWRKKWERDWETVKYCSDRCRREGKAQPAAGDVEIRPGRSRRPSA